MSDVAPATCPCCGGSLDRLDGVRWHGPARALLWRGAHAELTPQQGDIVDALWPSLQSAAWVPSARLVASMYAYRSDGGPDNATYVLRIQMAHIRSRLKGAPVIIVNKPWHGYRMIAREAA